MTKEENIATLNEHLDHWKRLLSEKICDQDEGEKTIDALQNAIKALEQEHILEKPHIKGDYYDGFKSGLRTSEWRNDKIRAEIRAEIEQFAKNPNFGDLSLGASCGAIKALEIIDKYKAEGNDKV